MYVQNVNLEILYYIWERKANLFDLPIFRSPDQPIEENQEKIQNKRIVIARVISARKIQAIKTVFRYSFLVFRLYRL